ncbi:MAG: hypothetical protein HY536_01350 [Candidatus Colwellbacteria bacterium]|nr:hypothetical protein [Candidatus Colwellbacteria bacterium]
MRLLVKGVRVVDGTGKPAYHGDILIVGDRITAIGKLSARVADETLDGTGMIATPGFIDPYSSIDRDFAFLSDPSHERYLLQGVTTVIGGHGGASLAPRAPTAPHIPARGGAAVNTDWRTVAEFYKTARQLVLGVHFGTFLGKENADRYVESLKPRNEADAARFMLQLEDEARECGMFGLSFSASDTMKRLSRGARGPAHNPEFATFSIAVGRVLDGRAASALAESMRALPNRRALLTELHPHPETSDALARLVNRTDEKTTGTDVRFALVPSGARMRPVRDIFAQTSHREAERRAAGAAITTRSRIGGPLRHAWLEGKTLGEFAQSRELAVLRALAKLAELEPDATIEEDAVDEVFLEHALFHPRSLISAAESGSHAGTPPFLEFLRRASAKLAIEKVIEKITGAPAAFLGVRDRGVVREGGYADLALLKDLAVSAVIVGGRVAVRDGRYTGARAGKVLRRTQ